MARVALVNLSSLRMPGNEPLFPLGLERIRQVLVEAGHIVRLIDFRKEPVLQENHSWIDQGWDVVGLTIRNIDPIDLSCDSHVPHYASYGQALKNRAANKSILWVGGGPGFSLFADALTRDMQLHVGVVGPGETTMLALCEDPGQHMRGTKVLNGTSDPDFADRVMRYDPTLMSAYANAQGAMIGVETRRKSCYQGCTYCPYAHITGNDSGDVRTMDSLTAEVRAIYDAGIHRVFFTDGIFNADLRHAKRVVTSLKEMHLPELRWSAYFTPKPFDDELAMQLCESGIEHVVVSPDSLDPAMMNELGKSFDTRHVLRFIKMCRQYGLEPRVNVVIGGPSETERSAESSLQFINDHLYADELVLHVGYRVLPETEMSRQTATCAADLLEPTFMELDPNIFSWVYKYLDSRFLTSELLLNVAAAKAKLKQRKTVSPLFSVARRKQLPLSIGSE